MKKLFSIIIVFAIMLFLPVQAQAVDLTPTTTATTITELDLGDGVTVTEEITTAQVARSVVSEVHKAQTYHKNGVVIAQIAVTASFQYDGKTVSVLSKKVYQKDTYQGWSFTQTSFTSSGGTVRLKGTLKKSGNSSVSVDLSMTCDKNGNIS